MAAIVLVILFIMALFLPKSRILYFSMMSYMWVLFVFNVGAPDTATYEWIYNENIPGAFEPFFTALMSACRLLGLPFVAFRMVVATLLLIFINCTFRKVENYKSLALAIYAISPFPWQVSGIRAALACVILMYAMSIFVENPKKNTISFCFWLLVATLVHYSSILFVVLLLARHETTKRKIMAYIGISVIGVLIVLYSSVLLDFVSVFTQREKIITWLSVGVNKQGYPNIKGFIAELIILFGNILFTWKSKIVVLKYNLEGKKTRIAKAIYDINVISILFIPLLRLNDTYMRLLLVIHGVNIILYVMAAFTIQEKGSIEKRTQWNIRPKTRFSLFVLTVPLWTYIIAIYQNYIYFNTSQSVIEFLGRNSLFY